MWGKGNIINSLILESMTMAILLNFRENETGLLNHPLTMNVNASALQGMCSRHFGWSFMYTYCSQLGCMIDGVYLYILGCSHVGLHDY